MPESTPLYHGIRELLLSNVRCFHGRHAIQVAPITIIVGENSTGKSTITEVLSAVRTPFFPSLVRRTDTRFQTIPWQSFVSKRQPRQPTSFKVGFAAPTRSQDRCEFVATYYDNDGEVSPQHLLCEGGGMRLEVNARSRCAKVRVEWTDEFDSQDQRKPANRTYEINTSRILGPGSVMAFNLFYLWHQLTQTIDFSSADRRDAVADLIRYFANALSDITSHEDSIVFLPVRDPAQRAYTIDSRRHVNTGSEAFFQFRDVSRRASKDKTRHALEQTLSDFGEQSGLFQRASCRVLGPKSTSSTFEITVTIDGVEFNLADVGYGVGQILPLVISAALLESEQHVVIPQPEVHLHPKAQAAFGSFVVDCYKRTGTSFAIETHSDYFLDRVRFAVKSGIIPKESVSVIYLERTDSGVQSYSLQLDSKGTVQNPPVGYRGFFLRETAKMITGRS